jgi:hypothetical protein
MSFQLLSIIPNPFYERSKKQARERLDRVAVEERIGWKQVQLIAQDLFGKTKGFTIGECKRLMEEIRKEKE